MNEVLYQSSRVFGGGGLGLLALLSCHDSVEEAHDWSFFYIFGLLVLLYT